MRSRMIVIILAGIAAAAGALAAAQLPAWNVGDTFTVNQHYAGSFTGTEGGSGSADITANGCTWTVAARGNQALCGGNPDVYTVTFGTDCPVVATGHATLTDPVAVDADFRLTQISLTGFGYVGASDLNLMGINLVVNSRVELFLFNNWVDIGTLAANGFAEACPRLADFQWPLDVGMNWVSATDFHVTGHYEAHLNVLGFPIDEVGDIDQLQALNYNVNVTGMETSLGCNAYRIDATETGGLGNMTSFYCDTWGWYAEKLISQLNLEGFTLEEMKWEITGAARPTPTPTPPPGGYGVDIVLPTTTIHTGQQFYVNAVLRNDGAPRTDVPFFCLLEVFGVFYFYPGWVQYPPDIDYEMVSVPTGETTKQILPSFTWPAAGGPVDGLRFYGAFLNAGMSAIDGDYDMVTWGYAP